MWVSCAVASVIYSMYKVLCEHEEHQSWRDSTRAVSYSQFQCPFLSSSSSLGVISACALKSSIRAGLRSSSVPQSIHPWLLPRLVSSLNMNRHIPASESTQPCLSVHMRIKYPSCVELSFVLGTFVPVLCFEGWFRVVFL